MPANETFREPFFVAIEEPGAKLARDISSMGIASTDGAGARAQQEKIAIARARLKEQNEKIAHLEQSINTVSNEQAAIKNMLAQILEKMDGK
jgi:small-conductance mechanosensitive channel